MKIANITRTIVLLAALAPTMAWSADWVVSKVSQPSRFTVDGKTWLVVTRGSTIPNASWVSTGPRGRVVLERNKDRVTFQPGTMAGVFEKKGWSIHTDFAQQSGTLDLSIDPQVKPHLAVQTPFLAAVVKGTVFTVTVTKEKASVGVSRGRVEVTDNMSGERTGIKAGQKATVDNDPVTHMALGGKNKNFEKIVQAQNSLFGWTPKVQTTSKPAASSAADDAAETPNKSAAKNSTSSSSSSGTTANGDKASSNSDSSGGASSASTSASGAGGASSGAGSAGSGKGSSGSGSSAGAGGGGSSSGSSAGAGAGGSSGGSSAGAGAGGSSSGSGKGKAK